MIQRKTRRRSLGNGRIWRRKQKGSVVWGGDWRDADGERRRTVLSSDRRVAERKLADLIRRRDLAAAGLAIEEGFDIPAAELMEEFLADLRSRRTKRYAERAECSITRVIQGMAVRTLRDYQPQPYLLYRRVRLQDGIANRTANHELTVVRTMLNWAVRAGYIQFNPLQAVQGLPQGKGYEKHPRRALTEVEIERLLAASAAIDAEGTAHAMAATTIANGTKGPGYAAVGRIPRIAQTVLWLALIETGARFGELVEARWGDFSEANATITLRAATTKSRKERTIPVRRSLAETIAGLRLVQHEVCGRMPTLGDHVFLTPTGTPWTGQRHNALKRFKDVLARAGIPQLDERGQKVDIHSLRHTCASRLARSGVGLAQAQRLLGHSDPKLTMAIYTHLETEDLRGAVEGVPEIRAARG